MPSFTRSEIIIRLGQHGQAQLPIVARDIQFPTFLAQGTELTYLLVQRSNLPASQAERIGIHRGGLLTQISLSPNRPPPLLHLSMKLYLLAAMTGTAWESRACLMSSFSRGVKGW